MTSEQTMSVLCVLAYLVGFVAAVVLAPIIVFFRALRPRYRCGPSHVQNVGGNRGSHAPSLVHPNQGPRMKTACPQCGGECAAECDKMFTPITDCEHKDAEDGCCKHPHNMTPECHVNACPRLNRKLERIYDRAFPL